MNSLPDNTSDRSQKDQQNPKKDIDLLEAEILKILQGKGVNIPEPKKKEIAVTIARSFSGPLPPPEILKEYEEVCPGTALKIVTAFVNQSAHRIDMESKVVTSQLRQSGRGQIYGFIIAVLFLIVSGVLIYTDHDVAGTILGTVDLVALCTVFVVGREKQKADLEQKAGTSPSKKRRK